MAGNNPRKKSHRSTDAERVLRVQAVYGCLCKGMTPNQIIAFATDKYDITSRTVELYIRDARILLEKDCDLTRPAFLAEAIARLRTIEQKAFSRNQLMVATNAIRLQCELIGCL